ncbi:MAG: helix-turn-helix transcriptional regulator [Leptospirales bacterium]|nr:helix-turn-helix transcriptional regulator [Leptospirales bacterium]
MSKANYAMQIFSIWNDIAAYRGPSFATSRHSHFFAQICLASEKPLRLRGRNGVWKEYRVAYIPSGISHETERTEFPFTIILMDPLTIGARIFQDLILPTGEPAIDVSDYPGMEEFGRINEALVQPNRETRWKVLQMLDPFMLSVSQATIDERIRSSIEYVSSSDDQISLTDVAKRSGLSAGRFRHLFREQTGIAYSGYRLWIKTRKAILFLAERPDLISAALEGGFSDQAHFSRIFRRSFGMAPSELRKNDLFRIQIFT